MTVSVDHYFDQTFRGDVLDLLSNPFDKIPKIASNISSSYFSRYSSFIPVGMLCGYFISHEFLNLSYQTSLISGVMLAILLPVYFYGRTLKTTSSLNWSVIIDKNNWAVTRVGQARQKKCNCRGPLHWGIILEGVTVNRKVTYYAHFVQKKGTKFGKVELGNISKINAPNEQKSTSAITVEKADEILFYVEEQRAQQKKGTYQTFSLINGSGMNCKAWTESIYEKVTLWD